MLANNSFPAEAFINDREGAYGLLCMTQGEAIECCEWMDSVGKRWALGCESFKQKNCWEYSKGEGIYYTSHGYWGNRNYLEEDAEIKFFQYWNIFKKQIKQYEECELLPSEELGSFLEDVQVV